MNHTRTKIHFIAKAVGLVLACFFVGACSPFTPGNLQMSPYGAGARGEKTALDAYRDSVYRFSRSNCIQCHESAQAPHHASSDLNAAYAAAKAKVSFADPASSILVLKSKDGHCGLANCKTDGIALTEAIRAWAPYESVAPRPKIGSGELLVTANTRLRLGTRQYVASKLNQLFGTAAQTATAEKILSQPSLFGGSCDLYGKNPTRLPPTGQCSQRSEAQAPAVPPASAGRLAYTIRSCDQILQNDAAVNAAAMKVSSSSSSQTGRFPTEADVTAVYRYFYRDRTPPPSVLAALQAVVATAQANGYPSIDGWRFLLLTVCSSPDWQIP